MKSAPPEMIEGPEAWKRFQAAMKRVVSVPHSEIQKRIDKQCRESAKNPNRRGPTPKNSSAFPGPAV